MNQEYQHSEIIEAYLRNDLSVEQKVDFEELVRQDPLLYNEFVLQQDIVSGLQNHRKEQLKSRLNQVEVSSPAQLGGVGAVGVWLAGATLAGLLGWFAYTGFHDTKNASPEISVVQAVPEQAEASAPEPVRDANMEEAAGNTSEKVKAPKARKKISIPRKAKTSKSVKTTVAAGEAAQILPDSDVPETPTEKMDSDVSLQKPPVASYNGKTEAQNRLNVVDNTNNRLKLHYYYQNGRIALLGFERGYTFLNVPAENTTYLFYEDNFYKLNLNQSRPAPIKDVMVTDAAVIESLRKLVENRN